MDGNPNRAMLQYEEKLRREANGKAKWTNRYYTAPAVELPTLMTASIAICILGHPLEKDGSLSEILKRRLDRAFENWRLSRNSTVMILCGPDKSMFPGAAPAISAMKQYLNDTYEVPMPQMYGRPEGLTLLDMSKDVSTLLRGGSDPECPTKSPIGVVKLITSDFNIVRARRCFGYSMKIYVSDDEVPSGLGSEDMMFMLDEEHRINHQYRLQGLYDADKRP